jgi:uncharacterized membrane protein
MPAEIVGLLFAPLRLVHALIGILLVAGLLGRWVALAHAERAAAGGDLVSVRALLAASSVFERTVIITSQLVFLLGLLTAWSAGLPLLGFLQGGSANWLLVSLVVYLGAILLVPTVFLPRGRIFGSALEDAVTRGHPTPGLVAAFKDPVSRVAHYLELAAVVAVLILMIAKPF